MGLLVSAVLYLPAPRAGGALPITVREMSLDLQSYPMLPLAPGTVTIKAHSMTP